MQTRLPNMPVLHDINAIRQWSSALVNELALDLTSIYTDISKFGTTEVSDPDAVTTTETAGDAYGANEKAMLTHLKADVVALQSKLTELINALQGCQII